MFSSTLSLLIYLIVLPAMIAARRRAAPLLPPGIHQSPGIQSTLPFALKEKREYAR